MTDTTELKRTPLYSAHCACGAKMVPFAGWEMPVLYSNLIEEHKNVRTRAGLFDVSHMGEIFVTGPEAEQALEYLTCNWVGGLEDGKAHYTAITNHSGGIVDDVIVYRLSSERYLVCVNAANIDKDFEWLQRENKFQAEITNNSSEWGQIALQGPCALEILTEFCATNDLVDIKYFRFREMDVQGTPCIVARTGYTGEDGFELFVPHDAALQIWNGLLEVGAAKELKPIGLGARDTLRLEACYPLYGHELRDDISAIESGLGWTVKLKKKGDFVGRSKIEEHKQNGSPRKLIGFFVEDKGIVREGAKLLSESGQEIGFVTSGTKTPTVDRALGLAIVSSENAELGTKVIAEVRGRELACSIAKIPFYKR